MNDKPILFSGPMVRALLEGRKTQTRRLMKPQPDRNVDGWDWSWPLPGKKITPGTRTYWVDEYRMGTADSRYYCPHGKPGELLWVRETWAMASRATDFCKIYYQASERDSHTEFHEMVPIEKAGRIQPSWPKWKPSIHMPRAFSRITLPLTDIRVQRLNEISEEDAISEGCGKSAGGLYCGAPHKAHDAPRQFNSAREAFFDLWEHINGRESLLANPWVWALSFTVHQQNIDDFLSTLQQGALK